jgi:hypothetical protein
MSLMVTTLRRSLWLLLFGAVGGAAWAWWRDHNAPPSPSGPPEWPPLEPATPVKPSTGTASIVNALVDAPEARSTVDIGDWVSPNDDASCPPSHPIKANDNSGIFHVPGGRFYERTRAERCYATAEAAVADGYRQAKA